MAEQMPALKIPPTPKATRSKISGQTKGREFQRNPPKQNPPKQNPPKQDPPLEPGVVVVPVDHSQGQDPPQDTNPPLHIPTHHLHQISQHICKIFPTSHQTPHQTQSNHQILHHKHQYNHLTLQQIHLI